jgi:AhpD family alkylhydroperoxidase
MEQRLDMWQLAPEAFKAVLALETYARKGVEPKLFELIKIRASMLNGCAYCVDMHTTDALKGGEDLRRIVAVSAWHESPYFSELERAVLDLTDAVTRLGEDGVSDQIWESASEHLDELELTNVVMAIAAINVWNRVAVTAHTPAAPLAVG